MNDAQEIKVRVQRFIIISFDHKTVFVWGAHTDIYTEEQASAAVTPTSTHLFLIIWLSAPIMLSFWVTYTVDIPLCVF